MADITIDALLRLRVSEAQAGTKKTAAEVGNLNEKLDQTKRSADNAERSIRNMAGRGGSVTKLSRAAGALGGNMGKVSSILGRVSPGLAEAAMITNELADATEAATAGGASLLRVLGPVGIAVGVAGAAYLALNAQLKEAEELQRKAAQSAADMADIHLQVRDAVLQRKVAEGELSEAEFNRIASARTAAEVFAAQKQSAQDRIDQLTREIDLIQKQTASRKQAAAAAAEAARSGGVFSEGGEMIGGMASPVAASRKQAAAATEDLTSSVKALAKELEAEKQRLETATTALDVLSQGEKRLANELTRTANASIKAKEEVQTFTEVSMESIGGLTDELNKLSDAAESLGDFDWDGWAVDVEAALAKAFKTKEFRAGRRESIAGTFGDIAGTGGDPLALLGLAGPVGAGVSAGLSGLASLGSMSDEDLDAMFTGLADNIVAGIARLPELLVTLIPAFVKALVLDLPPALAQAIGDIFKELWEKIRDLFSFRDRGDTNRSRGAGRASGGMIPRDGLYYLHQGEEIIRSSRVGTQGRQEGGQTARVRVELAAPSAYPTIQTIETLTGPGGLWDR